MTRLDRAARFARQAGSVLAVLLAAAGSVGADPLTSGPPSPRDSVTGYLCADPGCGFVTMTEASCICQKMNPWEQRLSRLELKCSAKEGGKWVACPVKPRYGISVR